MPVSPRRAATYSVSHATNGLLPRHRAGVHDDVGDVHGRDRGVAWRRRRTPGASMAGSLSLLPAERAVPRTASRVGTGVWQEQVNTGVSLHFSFEFDNPASFAG